MALGAGSGALGGTGVPVGDHAGVGMAVRVGVGEAIGSGIGVIAVGAARLDTMLFEAFRARMPDKNIVPIPAEKVIFLNMLTSRWGGGPEYNANPVKLGCL